MWVAGHPNILQRRWTCFELDSDQFWWWGVKHKRYYEVLTSRVQLNCTQGPEPGLRMLLGKVPNLFRANEFDQLKLYSPRWFLTQNSRVIWDPNSIICPSVLRQMKSYSHHARQDLVCICDTTRDPMMESSGVTSDAEDILQCAHEDKVFNANHQLHYLTRWRYNHLSFP